MRDLPTLSSTCGSSMRVTADCGGQACVGSYRSAGALPNQRSTPTLGRHLPDGKSHVRPRTSSGRFRSSDFPARRPASAPAQRAAAALSLPHSKRAGQPQRTSARILWGTRCGPGLVGILWGRHAPICGRRDSS